MRVANRVAIDSHKLLGSDWVVKILSLEVAAVRGLLVMKSIGVCKRVSHRLGWIKIVSFGVSEKVGQRVHWRIMVL